MYFSDLCIELSLSLGKEDAAMQCMGLLYWVKNRDT